MRIFKLLLVGLTGVFWAGSADAQTTVRFSSGDGTTITGYLMKPAGRGPFPAVVALHGCGGAMSTRDRAWGRRLVLAGHVVLFPDSFGSRGHGSLCRIKPRPVKQAQRVADAQGARRWLASQNFVKRGRISILGWSNGGSTVLRTAASSAGRGFRRAIAFYPGCKAMLRNMKSRPTVPTKIIIGASDDWTPPGPCISLARRWGMQIVVYKGAYHGFDSPGSKLRKRHGMAFTKRGDGTVTVGENPTARRKATGEVLRTLGR